MPAISISLRVGHCFEDALAFVMSRGQHDDPIELVHGVVSKGDGKKMEHAWVELPLSGWVFDPTLGYLAKATYYRQLSPRIIGRFQPVIAAALALRSGHSGPWSRKEVATLKAENKKGEETRQLWMCTKCKCIVSEGGPQDIPYHRVLNHCFAPVRKLDETEHREVPK